MFSTLVSFGHWDIVLAPRRMVQTQPRALQDVCSHFLFSDLVPLPWISSAMVSASPPVLSFRLSVYVRPSALHMTLSVLALSLIDEKASSLVQLDMRALESPVSTLLASGHLLRNRMYFLPCDSLIGPPRSLR